MNKKPSKTPTSTLVVRIVALILAFLMVAGGAYYVIASIISAFSKKNESSSGYTYVISTDDRENTLSASAFRRDISL